MPPAGPPRASQSSMRTSQPTPIIVPNPKVKYSTVDRPPWRRVDGMKRLYDMAVTHQPRASFQSPRFAQPATFMRLPHVPDARGLDVAIVGVPFDGGTSYRPGARYGPREI